MNLLDRVSRRDALNRVPRAVAPAPTLRRLREEPPPREEPAAPPEPEGPAPRAGSPAAAVGQPRGQAGGNGTLSQAQLDAKRQVHAWLLSRHADAIDITDRKGVRATLAELFDEYVRLNLLGVTKTEREQVIESLLNDILGLGPLEPLLREASVTEIMVNGSKQVLIEREGRIEPTNVCFASDRELRTVIDRIVSSVGRRVDESNPICDARLKDGSRVNVILPPLSLLGPCMTIRKFARERLRGENLVALGSATPAMIQYLEAAVRTRLNILVSGGTGSGKTTLLNILSGYIPEEERIVTCEDAAELDLQQFHVIKLEARPANVEGQGAVSIRDLVRNSLRMRPDRIIVGEVRGGEALDMLQAMNTGHEGSMSTLHANNPEDSLDRLETMVMMAGAELPSTAIRKQIASAINVIVQTERVRGGSRKIVSIVELTGFEHGEIHTQEVFTYRQVGVSAKGRALGFHTATGAPSAFGDHFRTHGERFPESLLRPSPQPPPDDLY